MGGRLIDLILNFEPHAIWRFISSEATRISRLTSTWRCHSCLIFSVPINSHQTCLQSLLSFFVRTFDYPFSSKRLKGSGHKFIHMATIVIRPDAHQLLLCSRWPSFACSFSCSLKWRGKSRFIYYLQSCWLFSVSQNLINGPRKLVGSSAASLTGLILPIRRILSWLWSLIKIGRFDILTHRTNLDLPSLLEPKYWELISCFHMLDYISLIVIYL